MARLQQVGFQFGEPVRRKSGGSNFPLQHPRNVQAAAAVLNHYYFYPGKVLFADTRKLILQVKEAAPCPDPTSTIRCDPLGIGYCSLEYDYKATESLEGQPLKKSPWKQSMRVLLGIAITFRSRLSRVTRHTKR